MLLLQGAPQTCTAALSVMGEHNLSLSPLVAAVAAKSDSQAAQPGSGRRKVGSGTISHSSRSVCCLNGGLCVYERLPRQGQAWKTVIQL